MQISSQFCSTRILFQTVQNLHLNFASSVLRALSVASTRWCALQNGFLSLALLDAALLGFCKR